MELYLPRCARRIAAWWFVALVAAFTAAAASCGFDAGCCWSFYEIAVVAAFLDIAASLAADVVARPIRIIHAPPDAACVATANVRARQPVGLLVVTGRVSAATAADSQQWH